jgi:hypothetical protein
VNPAARSPQSRRPHCKRGETRAQRAARGAGLAPRRARTGTIGQSPRTPVPRSRWARVSGATSGPVDALTQLGGPDLDDRARALEQVAPVSATKHTTRMLLAARPCRTTRSSHTCSTSSTDSSKRSTRELPTRTSTSLPPWRARTRRSSTTLDDLLEVCREHRCFRVRQVARGCQQGDGTAAVEIEHL